MQIKSNTYTMHLEDMPLDIGYASEEVALSSPSGEECKIGGHNGKTQLIITTPKIDSAFIEELKSIDAQIPSGGDYEVEAFLVVADDTHKPLELEKFKFLIDSNAELGDFYGVRLKGAPYDNELTKAAILISKDGAIFYDDFCPDLEVAFNADRLYRKIAAAQLCYTGKGCH